MGNTRNTTAQWLENYQRWQIKVTNEDGQRKTFTSSIPGRKGQTECNRKADAWLQSGLRSPETRCGALIEEWLSDMEKRCRVVTVDGRDTHTSHYDQVSSNVRNWVLPSIEFKKIGKLRLIDLQEILDNVYFSGRAKKTVENVRGAISLWLSFCRKRELTLLTTEDLVIPDGATKKEKNILQPADLRKLFSCDKTLYRGKEMDEWYRFAWRFSVVTGLRPGELIGLQRQHIKEDRILVRCAVNKKNVRTSGKNDNAIREIALFSLAKQILSEQFAMLRSHGIASLYVFPDPNGNVSNQQHLRKAWVRYSKHNELTLVTPYELRHTFVSVSSSSPVLSISDLRATVGHSQNMDTLGVYSHKLTDAEKRISSGVEGAFLDVLREEK